MQSSCFDEKTRGKKVQSIHNETDDEEDRFALIEEKPQVFIFINCLFLAYIRS